MLQLSMRLRDQFLKILFLLLVIEVPAYHLFANENAIPPGPVSVLEIKKDFYPMLSETIRDPDLEERNRSHAQLKILMNQLKMYRTWIRQKGNSQNDYRKKEYLGVLIRLAWYWNDKLNQEKMKQNSQMSEKITNTIGRYHHKIRSYGKSVYRSSKSQSIKQWVKFQVALIDYLDENRRQHSMKWLRQLSRGKFSAKQRKLIQLALDLGDSYYGDVAAKKRAIRSLRMSQNTLPKKQSFLAHLAMSKLLSDQKGDALSQKERLEFAGHLKLVSSLCHNLPGVLNSEIFKFSLGLWVKITDPNTDWGRPPFRMDCFKNLSEVWPVQERIALQFWGKGQFNMAKKVYLNLAKKYHKSEERVPYQERAIDLYRLIYEQDQNPFPFQEILAEMSQKYSGHFFGVKILNMHFRLVMNEIRRGLQVKKDGDLSGIRTLVQNYIKNEKADFRTTKLQVLLSELYMKRRLYAQASKVYGTLFRDSEGDHKRLYLTRQIAAQAKVANWDTQNPWIFTKRKEQSEEREKLLRLYYTLMQFDQSLVWQISRHIGLLEIALDRLPKAYLVWENSLKEFPKGTDAKKALGMLIELAEKHSNWEKMENLIYLGLEKSIRPQISPKEMDLRAKLEVALFQNALAYRKAGSFQKSVEKLVILENTYETSPLISDYLYLLADSYRKIKDYGKSLHVLERILALSPDVKWYRESLLDAATYYTGLADPEKSFLLYQIYLEKFPQDPKENQIRLYMSEILTGLSKYQEAYSILKSVEEEKLAKKDLQFLKEKRFYLSEKLFDGALMLKMAFNTVADADSPDILKIKSYMRIAENAYQKQDVDVLTKSDEVLQKFPQSPAVVDVRSYIRFLQVKLNTEGMIKSFKNILTEDFNKVVGFLDQSYREISTAYRGICKNPSVSYCVPGMQQLLTFNRRVTSFLEDVTPSQTMKDVERNAFLQEQQGLKSRLSADAIDIKNETRKNLAVGNTIPAVTRQMLWSLERDWNFRNGADSGPGFMQISKDSMKERKVNDNKKL